MAAEAETGYCQGQEGELEVRGGVTVGVVAFEDRIILVQEEGELREVKRQTQGCQ